MITGDLILEAIISASKKRTKRPDVVFVWRNLTQITFIIHEMLEDGSYVKYLQYRKMTVRNNNKKIRKIDSPYLLTLILEHLANIIIQDLYYKLDNDVGLNCKPGHGITATNRRYSVVKRMKHIYYDRRDLQWGVVMDQTHCYLNMKPKHARKALKILIQDRWVIDFIIAVSFVEGHLPVGTPSSPLLHHVIMLSFDLWVYKNCPDAIRYADDIYMPFSTIEEAHQMMWRVKQFWWFTYGVRANSLVQKVISLNEPLDFCGYVLHRNSNKSITDHNKGYASLRASTYNSAVNCKTNKSYASYFGLMMHADMYNVMLKIEKSNMNLRELTKKVKIERKLDAENIELKELAATGVEFTIYDYDLRKDAKGNYNWIKCLIGIPEKNAEGEPTGRILAREYHGGADAIVRFHVACEAEYGSKDVLLPMTEMVIEQKCGYLYQGSTRLDKYIDDDKYKHD